MTRAGWFTSVGVALDLIGGAIFEFATDFETARIGLSLIWAGAPFFLAGLIGLCLQATAEWMVDEQERRQWMREPKPSPVVIRDSVEVQDGAAEGQAGVADRFFRERPPT